MKVYTRRGAVEHHPGRGLGSFLAFILQRARTYARILTGRRCAAGHGDKKP